MTPTNRFNFYVTRLVVLVIAVGVAACQSGSEEGSGDTVDRTMTTRAAPFGLDASLLPQTRTSSSMAMVHGDSASPIGTAHHAAGRSEAGGRDVLYLILVQELNAGVMRDSLVVDAETLLPIEYFNVMPGMQEIHTVYSSDGHVRSEVVRGDEQTGVDTTLVGPYLDAAAFTSLLGAFPLADGMDMQVPVFHYEEGPTTYGIRVVGRETVSTCRGESEAWVVETTTGRNTTQHWIDQESREMVQVQVDLGGGRRFEQKLSCG